MSKYPKSNGALFTNNRREKDSHPHFRGNVVLTTEQLREISKAMKEGREPKLQLAGWKKVSQNGTKYISLEAEAYFPDESQGGQKNPPRRQAKPQQDAWDDDDEPSADEWDDDIPF